MSPDYLGQSEWEIELSHYLLGKYISDVKQVWVKGLENPTTGKCTRNFEYLTDKSSFQVILSDSAEF